MSLSKIAERQFMASGNKSAADSPYVVAQRAISRRDAMLRPVIKRVGPCTLRPITDRFTVLVRTIISQQLSTKAALTIGDRLLQLAPRGFTPERLDKLGDEQIRACGISGGKLKSIRDLCARIRHRELDPDQFPAMSDEDLREKLTEVHGIGPWSVDMYLIFCLGRLDVLPVGDLGLRLGVKETYGLAEAPSVAQMTEIGELWRPYRTVGTWYMWRSRGFVPQS
jgi:DNA-3-methyladenine glycosylase II